MVLDDDTLVFNTSTFVNQKKTGKYSETSLLSMSPSWRETSLYRTK